MPKSVMARVTNKVGHKTAIAALLEIIAREHKHPHGDVVIAYHEQISVYNVRQWLSRPVPEKHFFILSKLSGLTVDQVQKICTQHVKIEHYRKLKHKNKVNFNLD